MLFQRLDGGIVALGVDRLDLLDLLCGSIGARGLDPDLVGRETDPSDLMEGLYVKVEEGGRVVERYKFIRLSFLTTVLDSGSHWLRRPIVPNQLDAGADLWGGSP